MSNKDFKELMHKDNLEATTIHTDKGWTEKAQQIFKKLGIPFDEAINVFLHQVCEANGMPMEIKEPDEDTINSVKVLKKKLYDEDTSQGVKKATRPFRSYIKSYRKRHHMNQQELADKAHLSIKDETRAENGQNVNMTVYYNLAYAMRRNLGITIGDTTIWTHFHFPKRIPTPKISEIIKDEFMKPIHMSLNTLAQKLYLPFNYVKLVLEDKAPVNKEFDYNFSTLFNVSTGYLLRMQKDIQRRNQKLNG